VLDGESRLRRLSKEIQFVLKSMMKTMFTLNLAKALDKDTLSYLYCSI
jgi:hypothetical protein